MLCTVRGHGKNNTLYSKTQARMSKSEIEIIEKGNQTGANVHMWGGPEILISAVGGSKGTRFQIVRA